MAEPSRSSPVVAGPAPPETGRAPGRPRRGSRAAELKALLRQQESLRAVIESISSELELRPLLTRIVRHACELIGADHGTIGLVDPGRNLVRTEAIYRLPAEELGAEMPPGVGLGGQVLQTRQPVVLERYGEIANPMHPEYLDHAVIGVPISWRGRMIGFFGIGKSGRRHNGRLRRPRRFTPHDVETLAVFARHAAIAIENARRYEWEHRRTERLTLIARIGQIVTGNLRLSDLLQRAADAIHELLGYPNVAVPLILPDDPCTLVLSTVGGHYRSLIQREYRLPIDQGIMGAAARTRRVVLVNDVLADPRYIPTPGSSGITAELAVPILLGDAVFGVLNVESPSPFTEEDSASLQIVADQLAVAIENARLYEQAQELAVLQERHRLARELHDSVTQLLFSITLIAQSVAGAWERDRAEGERRIARVLELSRSALAEMRALLAELRPAPHEAALAPTTSIPGIARVRRDGLVAAISAHLAECVAGTVRVDLDAHGYHAQPLAREEALYRITQEAVSNVLKHAQARTVAIRLCSAGGQTRLTLRDDGVGFAGSAVPDTLGLSRGLGSGLGLLTMRERAEALGGTLTITSAPGAGTTVEVVIPSA